MTLEERILQLATEQYLSNTEFNGLHLYQLKAMVEVSDLTPSIQKLVETQKISLNFGVSHPNIHIKAFPAEPVHDQIDKLTANNADFCLYPTGDYLTQVVDRSKYEGMPFTLELALGEAQLNYRTFDLVILESYRNEPRYIYDTDDIGGWISITDQHYDSTIMPEREKILLQTFGFSYDKDMNRSVSVLLRYVANLTAEHQQIWKAKQLEGEYSLHPDYVREILGEFPEGISIFQAFLQEIQYINQMCDLMNRPKLFRNEFTDNRPKEFSFLIRPTLEDFNNFIHTTDKIISDNINKDFFQNEVDYEEDIIRKRDGKIIVQPKGTLRLLDEWLAAKFRIPDRTPIDEMLKTFKEIRKLRQDPAHSIDENLFDQKYFQMQRELITRAYEGIRIIRLVFANHSKVRGYEIPEPLASGENIWTY